MEPGPQLLRHRNTQLRITELPAHACSLPMRRLWELYHGTCVMDYVLATKGQMTKAELWQIHL